jgi:hypothetical protein
MNMEDDEFKPGKFEADIDQLMAHLETYSKMLASFKKALVDGGISENVAERIVEVWFSNVMSRR